MWKRTGEPGRYRCAARRAQGVLRQVSKGNAGPGRSSVRGAPAGPEDLRERLEGSLEDVGGAHEDAHERVPAQPRNAGSAGVSAEADGRLLLRRRRGPAAGLRAAKDQGVAQLSDRHGVVFQRLRV